MAIELVLLRHGESLWNKANRFTGWVDVDLSERGLAEAKAAGALLKKEGFHFDLAYTSVLKRAIRTLWGVLDETDQMWLPVERAWQLNERHYGSLQGLNKSEMAQKFGEEQVFQWRRSFDIPPPELEKSDPGHPSRDLRYQSVKDLVPSSEALKQCQERVMPYFHEQIAPQLKAGKKVLIVAHGNSLRALIQKLDQVSESEITSLNIPTGIPLIYQLNDDLSAISHRYLASDEDLKKAMGDVAKQGKAK